MTIIPTSPTHISYTATLLSPLHHGAGTSGNTSLLRTQEVVQPDGTLARVPYLSAASIRHALRDRLAWHLANTLNLEPGSRTKAEVDMLWTGGAVTKTGAEYNLDLARRVEEHFPALAMFGYAAQSDIITGTLRATDLILVCQENRNRIPDGLPAALVNKRAAHFRGEEFGTRHDQAASPAGRLIETVDLLTGITSTQMIWDVQIIKAGAMLSGSIMLTPAASTAHHMALEAAIALWAPEQIVHLGAKTATGYGQARLEGIGETPEALAAWTTHVETHGEEILSILRELTS